jgi:menaquinone-dependent protoporphyrinogen oxidase
VSARTLVAYASRHGSTAEIAQAIAATLAERGLQAEARPARDVREISGYDLVIVGSAVYMNKWQGDAVDFLKRFERPLATLPVWLFSSGPTGGTAEAEAKVRELVAAQPPAPGEAGKRAARIGVRGHATFGGRVDDTMTGLLERWMPRGDWRDQEQVRAWAEAVAEPALAAGTG